MTANHEMPFFSAFDGTANFELASENRMNLRSVYVEPDLDSLPLGFYEPLMVREILQDEQSKHLGFFEHYKEWRSDDQFQLLYPQLVDELNNTEGSLSSVSGYQPNVQDHLDETHTISNIDFSNKTLSLLFSTESSNREKHVRGNVQVSSSSPENSRTFNRRMELPMIIRDSTIPSRADSGSEENVMSLELAVSLGLDIDSSSESQRFFKVANGKLVKSLGRIMINCSFARDPLVELRCLFYVFQTLISPLIMGMAFLDETETLARHRHRLQPRSIPSGLPFQICSLDYPRRRFYCQVRDDPKLANADTGSEVNLLSLSYVQKRNFVVEEVEQFHSIVQFADGSTAQLLGKIVNINIRLGSKTGQNHETCIPGVDFYILEGLTCDILLGDDFLASTNAFESYSNAFTLDDGDDGVCEMNTIVWFNIAESCLLSIFGRNQDHASEEQSTMAKVQKRVDRMFSRNKNNIEPAAKDADEDEGDDDQRENHRREMARQAVSRLPESEREDALRTEQARIDLYEERKKNSHRTEMDLFGPSFKCEYPGCPAPPFQTEYLLNSHANVHLERRPWLCPVPQCPRSIQGRGFKRKNEMKRHQLVHESPGYLCPFCPEREHKYPRPDNLQRHVRVNHPDIDMSDVRLREVLAQRFERKSRSRRQREHSSR